MDITSFLLGYKSGAAKSGGSGGTSEGVDPYYQQLAESLMTRNAKYLGDSTVLNLKGFKLSNGDTLASLNDYSFAGFDKVEGMCFSDVVSVYENALRDCASLKIIDITASVQIPGAYFNAGSLRGCSALEAVIVRDGGSGVSAASVHMDNGANTTFCVYVPSEFYDAVVSVAANNSINIDTSRYRKLEDYPEVNNWNVKCTINYYDGDQMVHTEVLKWGESSTYVYNKDGYDFKGWSPAPTEVTGDMDCYGTWARSFAATSWEDIIAFGKDGSASEMWAIGDAKDLELNYADGTSETVTLKICGFNCGVMEDGNPCTIAFVLTQPLRTLQPFSTTRLFNAVNSAEQYAALYLPNFLETDVFDALPSALKESIKGRQCYYSKMGTRKLWGIDRYELNGSSFNKLIPTIKNVFPDANSRIMRKRDTGEAVEWWLGELVSYTSYAYKARAINTSGGDVTPSTGKSYVDEDPPSTPRGVIFGFCIG